MAKSAFAFKLGQRVNVPGKKGVQGVVTLPTGAAEFERGRAPLYASHVFFVRWVADDGINQDHAWFILSEMSVANEPEPATDGAGAQVLFRSLARDRMITAQAEPAREVRRHK